MYLYKITDQSENGYHVVAKDIQEASAIANRHTNEHNWTYKIEQIDKAPFQN